MTCHGPRWAASPYDVTCRRVGTASVPTPWRMKSLLGSEVKRTVAPNIFRWIYVKHTYIYIYYIILYYVILYYIVVYYTVLYCIVLYYITLYCIVLYYIILYCIILYYIILYYIYYVLYTYVYWYVYRYDYSFHVNYESDLICFFLFFFPKNWTRRNPLVLGNDCFRKSLYQLSVQLQFCSIPQFRRHTCVYIIIMYIYIYTRIQLYICYRFDKSESQDPNHSNLQYFTNVFQLQSAENISGMQQVGYPCCFQKKDNGLIRHTMVIIHHEPNGKNEKKLKSSMQKTLLQQYNTKADHSVPSSSRADLFLKLSRSRPHWFTTTATQWYPQKPLAIPAKNVRRVRRGAKSLVNTLRHCLNHQNSRIFGLWIEHPHFL